VVPESLDNISGGEGTIPKSIDVPVKMVLINQDGQVGPTLATAGIPRGNSGTPRMGKRRTPHSRTGYAIRGWKKEGNYAKY